MHKLIAILIRTLIILTLLPLVAATHQSPYHLKLLAVEETKEGFVGSDAELYLEIKAGSGRVFLDTFPLTRMDTQGSTRFAKEIACTHFKLPCDQYDFIYTIKSDSNIIGGPSAGAAIAALTTIAMLDLPYDQKVTATGTMNSGALVGPVGGVAEKIGAASQAQLTKVLVPIGSGNASNITSLQIVEVGDLGDIIKHLTTINLQHSQTQVSQNQEYQRIMQGLEEALCSRTAKIQQELNTKDITISFNMSADIHSQEGKAMNATQKGDYYSAASYCFGNNIQLKKFYYQQEDISRATYLNLFNVVSKKTAALEQELQNESISTISDLQAMMIVQERLQEVHDSLEQYGKESNTLTSSELASLLAYAEERLYSAQSWVKFFEMNGEKFVLNRHHLQQSCQQKINEAQEHVQYVEFYVGAEQTQSLHERIREAQRSEKDQQYELCLMKAIQAKAEANSILSIIGVEEKNIKSVFERKAAAVERVIVENTALGVFPIMGYSYYQYANSLQKEDPYPALLYLEYALEMSDLQIYFPSEQKKFFLPKVEISPQAWIFLGGGVLIGLLLGIGIGRINRNSKVQLQANHRNQAKHRKG